MASLPAVLPGLQVEEEKKEEATIKFQQINAAYQASCACCLMLCHGNARRRQFCLAAVHGHICGTPPCRRRACVGCVAFPCGSMARPCMAAAHLAAALLTHAPPSMCAPLLQKLINDESDSEPDNFSDDEGGMPDLE